MGLGTAFVITVTTARMIMPGMHPMPNIPGMKIPDLSAPTRTMTMDLTSEKKVNAQSKAQCAIPEGLKLGPKVDLTIDLPEPVQESEGTPSKDDKPGEQKKFVMKMYWNCAETVPAGQPKVVTTDQMMKGAGMSPQQMEKLRKSFEKSVKEAADRSHAYWPGRDPRKIDKAAATPGSYQLTTNYCGGTTISFDQGQDFLAAIDLVGMDAIDLEKTIKVEWKAVPNATAYLLAAFAGSENQMVIWTSSADPEMHSDLVGRAIPSADLKKLLDNGVLLPPTKTSCRIPAGIFKDLGKPMLTVTAFGTDKIQSKDGIETQVVVRSNAMAMLGKPEGMPEAENESGDQAEVQPASDNAPADGTSTENAGAATTDGANGDSQPKQEGGDSLKDRLKKKLGKFGRK